MYMTISIEGLSGQEERLAVHTLTAKRVPVKCACELSPWQEIQQNVADLQELLTGDTTIRSNFK